MALLRKWCNRPNHRTHPQPITDSRRSAAPHIRGDPFTARRGTASARFSPGRPCLVAPAGSPLPPLRVVDSRSVLQVYPHAASEGSIPVAMDAGAHAHSNRRERGARAHASRKRAAFSPVLLCFVGVIVLLANACHTLFAQDEVPFLGSFWRISLATVVHSLTPKPPGVKYELHTLPVDAKAVADGDTITVYVDTADPCESGNVPDEVQKAVAEQTKERTAKNYQKADALQKIIMDAGYRQVPNSRGEQVLAKKYRIRLRGIDAPENSMPYGKEAKEELVKLVQGRTLKISVYDTDQYGRLVGDVDCNGIFVQEHMLKNGFTWHYTAYDRRPELATWQNQAKASRMGLWASSNPEKPWEWRKEKHRRKT